MPRVVWYAPPVESRHYRCQHIARRWIPSGVAVHGRASRARADSDNLGTTHSNQIRKPRPAAPRIAASINLTPRGGPGWRVEASCRAVWACWQQPPSHSKNNKDYGHTKFSPTRWRLLTARGVRRPGLLTWQKKDTSSVCGDCVLRLCRPPCLLQISLRARTPAGAPALVDVNFFDCAPKLARSHPKLSSSPAWVATQLYTPYTHSSLRLLVCPTASRPIVPPRC